MTEQRIVFVLLKVYRIIVIGWTYLDSWKNLGSRHQEVFNNQACPFLFSISESESCSVVSHSLRPHGLNSLWNSPSQNTGVSSPFLLQRIFPTQVFHIAGGFFISWATREAQEYWSGSLSLLQRIFPTREPNWGLLHFRWILYQLSYEGSPLVLKNKQTNKQKPLNSTLGKILCVCVMLVLHIFHLLAF